LKLSIVIPVYNEEGNLSELSSRLNQLVSTLQSKNIDPEIIIVDDHSDDNSLSFLKELCQKSGTYNFIRLSKNSGSHVAIIAGFSYCTGDAAVFLASDLQDPPELIIELIEKYSKGYQVVWAYRKKIEGISLFTRMSSAIFKNIFNKTSNLSTPFAGADFALLDRKVYRAVVASAGSKPSLGALITWLGFKQSGVEYVKQERRHGKSKWTMQKKVNAFIDAFVGFSYKPMRFMTLLGVLTAAVGFLYSLVVIFIRLFYKTQIEGWASLIVVVLILGGVQMLMTGVLGEYLWRNLEESRKRPLFFIEEQSDIENKKQSQ